MHSLLACLSLTLLNHPRSGSHRLLEEKVNSLAEIMLHFRLPFDQLLLCVLVVWQSRVASGESGTREEYILLIGTFRAFW